MNFQKLRNFSPNLALLLLDNLKILLQELFLLNDLLNSNECELSPDICGVINERNNSFSPYTCHCMQGYDYKGQYDQPCEGIHLITELK